MLKICPQFIERLLDLLVLGRAILDAIHNRLHTLEILFLLEYDVFDISHPLLVLVVIVLEGIDDLGVTESDQTVLED